MKKNRKIFFVCLAVFTMFVSACSSNNDYNKGEWSELYRINVGGKYGFINENGDIVIEPQFDEAFFNFKKGEVCFARTGERRGLINTEGEFVVELDKGINFVWSYRNGIACCHGENNRFGIIDINGVIVLPIVYSDITEDDTTGFIVQDTVGNMGYVNNRGEFIVPCVYNEVKGFGDGLARVKKDDDWMFIDKKGDVIELLECDEILSGFGDNRAFVRQNGSVNMIDRHGKVIKSVDADSVFLFCEGYATFMKNGKYGKLDTNGNVFIEAKFDDLYGYIDGFAQYRKNDLFGVIDTNGNVVVDASHNLACANIKGYSLLLGQDSVNNGYPITYYDKSGNVVWKDMPGNLFSWPAVPTKEDYIAYFDSKLSELDPIEGIYYVSFNKMAVDRENDHASSNGSNSNFYAIRRSETNKDEFLAYVIDKDKPYYTWVKKFVQIGESNAYAVVNNDEKSTWSEDGKLVFDDPSHFEITLRTGGNDYYNWYVQCDFMKDYPSEAIYEQVQQAEWSGSGFAIADGYVATNYHVVNGAKSINIKGVNGDTEETYKGYVVATDREHDLAILRIVDKKFEGFDAIPYCIGKTVPEVGDDVFVLGYPKTNTMGQEVKLTNGIISAESGFKGDASMYQISAPVQPGNSGGPLFDNEGNVIGIICAKHADAENANYAVKVSYLFSLVNSSGIGIKMPEKNNVSTKSLSKKVKQVKPFVYLIECRSH